MAINLEECGILKEDILNGVVKQLCEEFDRSNDYQIRQEVSERIIKESARRVDEEITKVIQLTLETPFQPINVWGDKQGEATTVKQLVENNIEHYWKTTVDSRGRPTSSSYSDKQSRATYMTSKLVEELFDKKVKDDVQKIYDELKERMRKDLARVLQETLNRTLK